MRIAFMGTPKFAADILEGLAAQHEVVCIYTMPDKVRGRGKRLVPSPVKAMAQDLGVDVRTPATLSNDEELGYLREADLDAICVAAYGKLLPEAVLETPRYGCLNVHASLLPRWRGAAPVERAILAGDEQVGVCIMQMEKGLDTGPYCVRRSIPAAGKTASELTDELAFLGLSALLSALTQIEEGRAVWTEQNELEVAYADKVSKGELNLNPDETALVNLRRVLASSDVHPSRFMLSGADATVASACIVSDDEVPASEGSALLGDAASGDVRFTKKRLFMRAADAWLEVKSLKPAGRREMTAASYLAGAHLGIDSKWGSIGGE